jgi:hypothetical protein
MRKLRLPDADWFGINLSAGACYQFDLKGALLAMARYKGLGWKCETATWPDTGVGVASNSCFGQRTP